MLENNEPNELNYEEFAEYVQSEKERFYRLAFSYVRNREAALDIIQNATYRALKSLKGVNEVQYIGTWFYKILINTCIDELRHTKRMLPTDPFEIPESVQLESIEIEQLMDLHEALNSLSPEDKTIVVLRYFEDLKLQDIAEILEMNLSTVKNKLYKSLKHLKIELKGEGK